MPKTLLLLLACLAFACQNQNDKNSDINSSLKPEKITAIQVDVAKVQDTTFY